MKRRAWHAIVAAGIGCFAIAATLLPAGTPAAAAAPDAAGYWWVQQTGTGPALPPPPAVPAGGLWVSYAGQQQSEQGQTAGGNNAIAALRIAAQPGYAISGLTLTVAPAAGNAAPTAPPLPALPTALPVSTATPSAVAPVIDACPTTSHWTPAQAGVWSQAPVATCKPLQVEGLASADGSSYTFNTQTLLDSSGALDVVIEADPGTTTPFSIAFEPPDATTVTLTSLDTGAPPPQILPPSFSEGLTVPPAVALPAAIPVPSALPAATPRPAPRPQPQAAITVAKGAPGEPLALVVLMLAALGWIGRYVWAARGAAGRTLVPTAVADSAGATWQQSRSLLTGDATPRSPG